MFFMAFVAMLVTMLALASVGLFIAASILVVVDHMWRAYQANKRARRAQEDWPRAQLVQARRY